MTQPIVISAISLRVHSFLESSSVNGPGQRAVIWLQGCSIGCPRCWNPATHLRSAGSEWDVEEILSRLSLIRSRIEISGLTISGGEPLEQAPGLVQLVEDARGQFPDLSIGLFSGYSETELDRGRYLCFCWVETDESSRAVIQSVTGNRMRYFLPGIIRWYKNASGSGPVDAKPPMDVVNNVLATPSPRLPVLIGVVEVPVFGPDGSLQTEPGYHPSSHTFYVPQEGFSIPEVQGAPSPQDVEQARALIERELIGDFPFVGDAEKAHAIALLLHPFARNLVDGPTPLHLIEKPTPGTGGSLLAEALLLPAIGRSVPIMTEGRDEEEWRRRITAKLKNADPVALIDNIRHPLDSAQLAAAITSTVWEDRLIGSSEMLRLPVRCAWVATGNNPTISDEIARRTVRIRLDSRQGRPGLRNGFRHPDLRDRARQHRSGLVWAALVLIRAWVVAGRPAGNRSIGAFESWSAVLGGILGNAGIPGFLGNLGNFYETANIEDAAWQAFMGAWWTAHRNGRVVSADLHNLARTSDPPLDLGSADERSQRISLGRRLGSMRDRRFSIEIDGSQLTVVLTQAGRIENSQAWKLQAQEIVQNQGDQGGST